jgi:drug/metabolite transporter (DMT)-like permease
VLLAGSGGTWGASFLFIDIGLDAFAPGVVTLLRLVFGFFALALFPASRRKIDPVDRPRVALLALTWLAFPLTMFPLAEQRVTSSVAGMLNGATPLATALFATWLFRRPPGRRQGQGIALGLAGVVMIAWAAGSSGANSALGVAMILAAVTCYGLSFNLAVPLQQRYGGLALLWHMQMVAIVLTLPFGCYGLAHSTFAWGPLVAVAALGAFGTGFAYVANTTLSGRVGGTRASVAVYLTPAVAIALGAIVRGDRVRPLALVGIAAVLAAAALTSRAERPATSR